MFFLSQHLDFWLCCWLFLVLQDTNYEGKYRLCFTGVFLPGIFIQESVEYPFPFTVVYKLVQHDFLPGSSHSSDCTDPQQGGGGKCFGNGSQHRAQLHNCTEEEGFFFFLVWFVFQVEDFGEGVKTGFHFRKRYLLIWYRQFNEENPIFVHFSAQLSLLWNSLPQTHMIWPFPCGVDCPEL